MKLFAIFSKTKGMFILYILAGLISAGLLFFYFWFNAMISPVQAGAGVKTVKVVIPPASSSQDIGKGLFSAGVIKSPGFFSLYSRLKGMDNKLKAGSYNISTGDSLEQIVQKLVAGTQDMVRFTVPEGYNLKQVAGLLNDLGLVEAEAFNSLIKSTSISHPLLKAVPLEKAGLEGYLYPDTYFLDEDAGAEEIIDIMLSRFQQQMDSLGYQERAAKLGLSQHQAVTIASLVEGEARLDSERPLVASVIMNRLKRGMPLQIDATVEYALGSKREKIYYVDLEVDNPYNTYRIAGLPPGPICSPGVKSLLAAVEPADTNYLYYVAKPDGSHAFSSTLEQHNKFKAMYVK